MDNDYEKNYLENLILTCVKYYKNKYPDNINSMFRKDEIFDDILKYILYIYGNSMLNKAFS